MTGLRLWHIILVITFVTGMAIINAGCSSGGGGSKSPAGTSSGTGTGSGTGTAEGVSVTVHLNLTMSQAERSAFESRIEMANDALWEATEGQMFLASVTIGYGYGVEGCNWYIEKKGVESAGVPGNPPPGPIGGWYVPDYTNINNPNKVNERMGTGTEFTKAIFVHEFSHWKLQNPMPFEAYSCKIDSKTCVRAPPEIGSGIDRYLFCDDSNSADCGGKCAQSSSWGHMLSFKSGWKHPNTFNPTAPNVTIITE
ncbi:MAG: hypothetical protein ACYS8W_01405 [Planctomycetota bacterium]